MNKLIFSLAALTLLGTQINAQVAVAPKAPESPRMNISVPALPPVPTGQLMASVNNILDNERFQGDDPKRTKTFTKSFTLDNGDKVNLSNQYGSLIIKTWDKKEIKVDVTMEAYSDNDKDAQKLIDEVNIDANKSGDVVSFKTTLVDHNGRYGTSVKNGRVTWRREIKVNYVAYMPASNAVTASMQYGNITIPDFSAPTSLKVQYGNLIASKLSNANNYIHVQYGKINVEEVNKATVKYQYGGGLNIGTAGTVDLNVQYAGATINTIKGDLTGRVQYGNGLTVGSVDNVSLNAQYTSVKINTVNGNATIDQQYNNLNLGTVGKLNLKTQYVSSTIGTLKGDGTFVTDYNKLTISEVTTGCKSLSINSDYTSIILGFSPSFNANLDVKTSYAGFKYGTNVSARRTDDNEHGSDKEYSGKIGNGGTATVKIDSDYGGITIK